MDLGLKLIKYKSGENMKEISDNTSFELEQCYLLLTRRCNLSCTHCIRSSDSSFNEYIKLELANLIITDLSSKFPYATLLLSGGEPTLHPNFGEIVHTALNSFSKVIINTNGMNLKRLKQINLNNAHNLEIQISIDGDLSLHESIRGSNTFYRTLSHIDELSKAGYKVIIASTVSNKNIDSMLNLDSELTKLVFQQWNLKRIVGYGRASDLNDIKTEQWNSFVSYVHKNFQNIFRIKINSMFSLASILKMQNSTKPTSNRANCGTGRSKLYINPNGTVYPCACMEEQIIGNFNNETFSTIQTKLENFSVTPTPDSICQRCYAWKQCQGGCPGISRRMNSKGDPRCPIVKKFNYAQKYN